MCLEGVIRVIPQLHEMHGKQIDPISNVGKVKQEYTRDDRGRLDET